MIRFWSRCSSHVKMDDLLFVGQWTFTWKSHGGNHPEVKVNDSKLTGVQVTTTVTTIQDGGLFMDPIPGEFLRVPSNQTQVSDRQVVE